MENEYKKLKKDFDPKTIESYPFKGPTVLPKNSWGKNIKNKNKNVNIIFNKPITFNDIQKKKKNVFGAL